MLMDHEEVIHLPVSGLWSFHLWFMIFSLLPEGQVRFSPGGSMRQDGEDFNLKTV